MNFIMKKIFLQFIFLTGFNNLFQAQVNTNAISNTEVFIIPLKEKMNLPLRKLPIELIKAYCEGNIKAYYPLDTAKECSYHEFVGHFHSGACQPQGTASANEFQQTPCPESFCNRNDESILENFLFRIELIETKRFDKNKSVEIYDIKYVRLKYLYYQHAMEIAVDGPIFKYADIVRLSQKFPDRYNISNLKNNAENFSIRKILDSRMFNGTTLTTDHHNKKYPRHRNNQQEDDKYHH